MVARVSSVRLIPTYDIQVSQLRLGAACTRMQRSSPTLISRVAVFPSIAPGSLVEAPPVEARAALLSWGEDDVGTPARPGIGPPLSQSVSARIRPAVGPRSGVEDQPCRLGVMFKGLAGSMGDPDMAHDVKDAFYIMCIRPAERWFCVGKLRGY